MRKIKLLVVGLIVCSSGLYAELSPSVMQHFFKSNTESNLQYLVGKSGVSSYKTLSDEHKVFIQKITNIILTDKYAKNLEAKKKGEVKEYLVVSSWKKELKTGHLRILITRITYLLDDIEQVTSGVDLRYKNIISELNKYKKERWYILDENIFKLLRKIEPKIERVLKVHRLLKEKGLAQEKDFRKKEAVILKEIERVNAIIKGQEEKIKGQEEKIKGQEERRKKLDKRIKELNAYLKVLKKFRKVVSKRTILKM